MIICTTSRVVCQMENLDSSNRIQLEVTNCDLNFLHNLESFLVKLRKPLKSAKGFLSRLWREEKKPFRVISRISRLNKHILWLTAKVAKER